MSTKVDRIRLKIEIWDSNNLASKIRFKLKKKLKMNREAFKMVTKGLQI
jgi:hypothetical protein